MRGTAPRAVRARRSSTRRASREIRPSHESAAIAALRASSSHRCSVECSAGANGVQTASGRPLGGTPSQSPCIAAVGATASTPVSRRTSSPSSAERIFPSAASSLASRDGRKSVTFLWRASRRMYEPGVSTPQR